MPPLDLILKLEGAGAVVRTLRVTDLTVLPDNAAQEDTQQDVLAALLAPLTVNGMAGVATQATLAAVQTLITAVKVAVEDLAVEDDGVAREATLELVRLLLADLAADDDGIARDATLIARLPQDSGRVAVAEAYGLPAILAQQTSAPGSQVMTFDFTGSEQAVPELIWVRADMVDPDNDPMARFRVGADPSINVGIPCEDGVPNPITARCSAVRVWAPVGAAVNVWGYGLD